MGRTRWTLFGASEHGPARAFWRSFFAADGGERPAEEATRVSPPAARRRLWRVGRIDCRPSSGGPADPAAGPSRAAAPLLARRTAAALDRAAPPGSGPVDRGRAYLLTFRPFGMLPEGVQQAYASGGLHLLPFPGSLLFWGDPMFLRLPPELPAALQIPLLWHIERHAGPSGLRVPQSGWMHEPRHGGDGPAPEHAPLRNTFRRTHRHARVHRDAPAEQTLSPRDDRMAHVLFDASEAIGLYGKPMARNAQLWTADGRLLLDGPSATHDPLERAAQAIEAGGVFGYRFLFPAMHVGRHEVFWHRPLVTYIPSGSARPAVVPDAPLGVLTASHTDRPGSNAVIELWPEILARAPYVAAATLFVNADDPRPQQTARNCRKLLVAQAALGGSPLPRSFARRLLTVPQSQTLDEWLDALPARANDPTRRALAGR